MRDLSAHPNQFEIIPLFPRNYTYDFYLFFDQKFLSVEKEQFAEINRANEKDGPAIEYSVLGKSGNTRLRVAVSGTEKIHVVITPTEAMVSETEISNAKEDIAVAVDIFEEQVRRNSLFFAWREGESVVPEVASGKENKSLRRIFLETQILLIAIFMGLGLFLFLIIGPLVPIILLAIQFVFVFYSNKIVARYADWHITEKNPFIHILQYPLSPRDDDTLKRISKKDLVKIKKQIYDSTIAENGELDREKACQIFSQNGISCSTSGFITKKVNVYDIVKRTADKFGYKVPETIVSNTLLPNAAASGPSPSRGIVLITTGTLLQLDDDEIVSVLGHEFGHLKGRDPLWLYGLSAIQYLFWFYILFGLFPTNSLLLLLVYYWALATLTYFIAKFFEARADLISAIVIGKPNVLANALEKIGYQRLLYERTPSFRFQEWLSMDPHPPVYFRIARLRRFSGDVQIKHPLIQSGKEVIKGFINSFA